MLRVDNLGEEVKKMTNETLVDLLARTIAEEHLNMTAAAAQLGVSRQTLKLWLEGVYDAKLDRAKLEALAAFTGEPPVKVLIASGLLTEADLPGGVTRAFHLPTSDLHRQAA